jgi:glycosyltransferase involved in cell wall biosynthesis
MKKVLFVGPYPPPFGGIASHLHDLLPELVKSDYEVICLNRSFKAQINDSSGIKVISINLRRFLYKNIILILSKFISFIKNNKEITWLESLRIINFSQAIVGIVKKYNVDAIFLYEENALVIPALKTSISKSIPIGLMIFGEYYQKKKSYRKITSYMSTVFKNCDIILSSSRYCGDSISRVFGFNFPVTVVYVGVNEHVYTPKISSKTIRSELKIPQNAIVFFFLGRMNEEMGIDFLLRVADRLLSIHPDIYVILAGAKGNFSILASDMAKREPRVKYCLNIQIDKKPDFYHACDIFLAPTKEGHACMGVSIKEAMACGKPVIASISGGIPEAIEDGINGYLIPFKDGELDEEIFFECASSLVNDSSLRFNMGNKGREKVLQLFSNYQTTKQYLKIMEYFKKNKTKWNKN